MTSHEAAAHDGGADRGVGPLPFDTSVGHQARMYDYLLDGKDNISQVVPVTPDSASPVPIQRCESDYSKTGPVAVRGLACNCLWFNVRFSGRGFLTVA